MEEYEKSRLEKMRFQRAEIYSLAEIRTPAPFWDATGGPFYKVPVDCWLVLYDDNQISGQGPCSKKMQEQLLPLLLNGETRTYREWYEELYWSIRNCGFSGEAAVELGRLDYVLHDILAKRKSMPLHRFLGAKRDWALAYASGCGTNLSITQAVKEAEEYLAEGYQTLKIKVAGNFGADLAADVKKIEEVRKAAGDKISLAVDVNQLWSRAEDALEFIKQIEEYRIQWLEEPVHSYNMRELKRLTGMTDIPIAMGESPRCYYPMEAYVDAGVRHLEPIPSNLSSVEDWMRSRKLAYENGIQLSSGGYSHMTAAFIASGREEDMVEYLIPVMRPLVDIREIYPREEEGKFILPQIPGSPMVPDFKSLVKNGYIEKIEILRG